jgi:cytochrome c5
MSIRTLVVALLAAPIALTAQGLPDEPGADIARARCVSCHEADLIVQQRLSRTGWERSLDKMVRWGGVVEPTERAPLLDYLTRHFGPKPAASHAPAAEALYKRACLTCHESDLVDQQRLSRAGWVREVDKMIRWGAIVPDAEKDALVDYLLGKQVR